MNFGDPKDKALDDLLSEIQEILVRARQEKITGKEMEQLESEGEHGEEHEAMVDTEAAMNEAGEPYGDDDEMYAEKEGGMGDVFNDVENEGAPKRLHLAEMSVQRLSPEEENEEKQNMMQTLKQLKGRGRR